MSETVSTFWSLPADALLQQLESTPAGLTSAAAEEKQARLRGRGLERRQRSPWSLLADQFKSPIILLLFGSAVLSYLVDDPINATIILFILVASGLLSFWQEWSAADAVEKLLAVIQTETTVLRDGLPKSIPVDRVVPGDVIVLSAGHVIPGDGRLLESRNMYVNEAALTGESFPAEKTVGVLEEQKPLSQRTNSVFLGTHVISGTGNAVLVATGPDTEFGRVSARLQEKAPESGFERGLRDFGNLLIKVTLCIVAVVFTVKMLKAVADRPTAPSESVVVGEPGENSAEPSKPIIDSFMFALALAVGMTPQLLPAITSVVMAFGAKAMAREQVIVKQMIAIENFGSMTVLCSDKTGTLTEGEVHLHAAHDTQGAPSERVLQRAYLNALLQAGFNNPIDNAIRNFRKYDAAGVEKLDEVPYDFGRKRLSVLVAEHGERLMITKGAYAQILECCTHVETPSGAVVEIDALRDAIEGHFYSLSDEGYRVLGVAICKIDRNTIEVADERNMTFLGFLVFYDPPKAGIAETLRQLRDLGISLKIITGDNRVVAAAVGRQVGIDHPDVVTGHELRALSDDALLRRVSQVDLFAEVEPNQKEQIIRAIQRTGQTVGFMGDGINDASALHAADVGISVASAVDVAREAAQVVLLQHDLSVLIRGVREGRRTFANTLKYVFFVISANFGYMFSLGVASLFLPFEPLLASQILLVNLLADFPAMALATDSVDPELIERPRRWDAGVISRFMLTFGLSSSIFDFITFGVLLFLYHADEVLFHTVWFVQSTLTGVIIMLIIRTKRPFFRSLPGFWLGTAGIGVSIVTVAIPYLPFNALLGFRRLTPDMLGVIAVVVALYALCLETVKTVFYRTNTEPALDNRKDPTRSE